LTHDLINDSLLEILLRRLLKDVNMLLGRTVALLMAASVVFATSAARADFVYSYSGTALTAGAAPFVGNSVTGEFTVASALGDNFNGVIAPTQFSFTNGLFSVGNSTASFYSIDVQTSSTGAIIDWAILVYSSHGSATATIQTTNSGDSTTSLGPTTLVSASNSGAPGTWSASNSAASATPLPAALPLFAGGLGALGLLGWRRKRKAAALAA
jgi:hypothetical protein